MRCHEQDPMDTNLPHEDNGAVAQLLIDHSRAWILWFSPEASVRYSSPSSKSITGYSHEQFENDKELLSRVIHEDDIARFKEHQHDVIATRCPGEITFRVRRPDGSIRWIQHQCEPIFDVEGHFLGSRSDNTDITERRFYQTMLQSQYDLGQALVSARSLSETLEICLNAAITISSLDCGGIYLLDSVSRSLTLVSHSGLPEDFLHRAAHYPAGDPHIAFIMSGKPTYAAHISSGIPSPLRDPFVHLRTLAVVPFTYEGAVIGCMNVGSHTLDVIPEEARTALETIATQIGGAIARARLTDTIRQERTNLHALFSTIKDFLFILDENGNIVFTNPVVAERLGYNEADLYGVHVSMVHPPAVREEANEIIAEMLAGRRESCPLQLLARDGHTVPVETRVIRGAWNGRPAIFGISRDTTERERKDNEVRQLLKEKNLLLHEVHHRIKNNMTLITSLLSLQAASLSESDGRAVEVLKDAELRVRAMVDIYDKLYRETDYRTIGLQSYLTSLLTDVSRHFTTSDRVRIEHDVDDALLDTRIVFPLGIIVTELVTNALKYAFPEPRGGVIHVQLKIEPGKSLRLRVADNGIGVEKGRLDEHTKGFGMQLVDLLAQQISGESTLTAVDGTTFSLVAPIPETTITAS
jgi:PAS domain S-box-containing protein